MKRAGGVGEEKEGGNPVPNRVTGTWHTSSVSVDQGQKEKGENSENLKKYPLIHSFWDRIQKETHFPIIGIVNGKFNLLFKLKLNTNNVVILFRAENIRQLIRRAVIFISL